MATSQQKRKEALCIVEKEVAPAPLPAAGYYRSVDSIDLQSYRRAQDQATYVYVNRAEAQARPGGRKAAPPQPPRGMPWHSAACPRHARQAGGSAADHLGDVKILSFLSIT